MAIPTDGAPPKDIQTFGQDDSGVEHGSKDKDQQILEDEDDPEEEEEEEVETPPAEEEGEESEDEDEEEEEDEDDEDEDDEEDEDEEEEPKKKRKAKEEDDDEEEFSDRPSVKTIHKKFPGLFKAFPGLRQAYFNERAFREVFPDVDSAKEAASDSEILGNIRTKLLDGDINHLLSAVHAEKPEAVKELTNNFLPTLKENAPNLYLEAITPILVDFIQRAYREGEAEEKTTDPKGNLKNAAKFISKFMTGKFDIPELPKKQETKDDPKIKQQLAEISAAKEELAGTFRANCSDDAEVVLSKAIQKQITKHIDPENKMKPYEKRMMQKEIRQELGKLLKKDTTHRRNMDRVWDIAVSKGFRKEAKSSVVNAFLGRAVKLLPLARRAIQSEVLEGQPSKRKKTKQIPTSTGKVARQPEKTGKVPRGMSDEDFLNSK